jgi:xanthine dehydrogenase accessory factor
MDMYEEIVARLRANEELVLSTIIFSEGSTPLRAGARMLVGKEGSASAGTIGGGLVEAETQKEARALLAGGATCAVRRFSLTEDQSDGGLLCGGIVEILNEKLVPGIVPLYADLIERREAGRDAALVTMLGDGPIVRAKFPVASSVGPSAEDDNGMKVLREVVPEVPASFRKIVDEAIAREHVIRIPVEGGELIIEPVAGLHEVVIFGGGHVSLYLSRCASMAGFRVTVVDDRPEYANAGRFPEAYNTLAVNFDAAWSALKVRPATSIVIVTRGHAYDGQVLERAVQTTAGYIGMIGSKRKVIAKFEELLKRGISRELLRKVHAPIGLAIGAMTAEEIAISITAELIAARRGVLPSVVTMSDHVRAVK